VALCGQQRDQHPSGFVRLCPAGIRLGRGVTQQDDALRPQVSLDQDPAARRARSRAAELLRFTEVILD
jgi:hypothetical protein